MKTPEHRYLLLSLILGTLAGCASAPDRPDAAPDAPAADAPAAEEAAAARFPSTKELDALSAQDLDISELLSATVEVEHWDMASAPPAQVGTRPQAELGPWEQPLKAAVDTRPGLALMSEGMACVAREYGKFWLTSQGSAPESLKNFWMMACGESAQGVGFSTISWDTLNPETTAEKLLESTQESLAAKGKKMMASSPHVYGAWFGREGDKAIVVFASAQRRVHMEPAAIVADAEGWVSLQGELLGGYDRLHAEINHGAYSTESCERVEDVALPRFHLRCPMAPGDKNARIDVAGFPPGRIIGQGVLQVIARRTPEDAPTRWERPLFAIPAEVDALEKPQARLLGMLNHIRQIAGKGPLTLAEAQSETATELTPHFFAALYGKQPALIADRVALGLRAGWDIPTAVRDGEMTQAVTTRPEALGALFAEALAAPMQRRVLMRESSQIAIGLLEAPGVLGATFTLYNTHDGFAAQDARQLLMDRLNAARAAKGLPPASPLELVKDETEAALAVLNKEGLSEESMNDALNQLSQRSAQKLQGSNLGFQTWLRTADSLDALTFPEELLTRPFVLVNLGVTVAHPENEPWAVYTVTFLAQFPEGA